jgi:DeoR/GlpR family transcriptional regulator of sugar metabolism
VQRRRDRLNQILSAVLIRGRIDTSALASELAVSPEKQRIARCAAQFLDGARVIGTTGGTTVSQFARLLRDRDGLTVVTNALNIAPRHLRDQP